MRTPLAALAALLVLAWIPSAARDASASCGSENCPVDHATRWDEARFSFDLSQQYIDQDHPRIGTNEAVVGQIPAPHDEVRTVNRITTARASYRPSEAWSASLSLPYVDRTHEHIHNHLGEPEYLRWNYSGIGDAEAAVVRRLGASPSGGRYFVSAGVKAPTGKKNVELVDGDQPEPSARPGTGSWDFLAGLGAEWRVGSAFAENGGMPLRVGVNGRWNGKGTEEYQVGAEVDAHVGTEVPAVRWGSFLLQSTLRITAKDDVGETDAEAANTGGTVWYVVPGMRVGGAGTYLYGLVQIPVYRRVNGIQIVSDSNLYLGVTHTFLR